MKISQLLTWEKYENLKKNDVNSFFKKGRVSVIYGSSGLGKTTITIYLSLMLSKGKDLFNGLIKVRNPKKVLYVSMELEKEDLLAKFYPIMKHYRIREVEMDIVDMLDINDIDDVKHFIENNKSEFVVIDSLIAIYKGRSLNDVIEVKEFFMKLKKIAIDNNCHILIIHHTNKDNEKDKKYDTYLGASSIKNQSTPFIKVGRDKGTFIEIEKTNFAVPFRKLYYYIDKNGGIRWYVRTKLSNRYDDILEVLKKEKEVYVKDLINKVPLSDRTVYRYLGELEELGIIEWKRKYTDRAFVVLNKKFND